MSEEATTPPKEEEAPAVVEAAETASTATTTSSTDAAGTAANDATDDDADKEGSMSAKLHNHFHNTKVDGGKKSLWAMTIETFSMSDGGKTKKQDAHTNDKQQGILMLKDLLDTKRKSEDEAEAKRWELTLTPFADFNATTEDLLKTFVVWSYKEETQDYNITKAFRRLESYVKWMEDNRKDLEQGLTQEEKLEAHKLWGPMKLTRSTVNKATLVYWIDMTKIDSKALKQFDHAKTLRYILWTWHYMLFMDFEDMIIVENMNKVGMIQMLTMVPADLGAKFDRLTIGVMPVKMKAIYFIHNPKWMSVCLTIMKPFLSKKMRQRMIAVSPKENLDEFMDKTVGKEAVPAGFCDLEGVVEKDELEKLLEM